MTFIFIGFGTGKSIYDHDCSAEQPSLGRGSSLANMIGSKQSLGRGAIDSLSSPVECVDNTVRTQELSLPVASASTNMKANNRKPTISRPGSGGKP